MSAQPFRPLRMGSPTIYRLHSDDPLDAWTRPSTQSRRIRGVRAVETAATTPRSSSTWELVALITAMTGMGILAWKLHESQGETNRLGIEVKNLTTIAQASLADHRYTKRLLDDANADKRMLSRFLTEAGAAEKHLKRDLTSLLQIHEQTLATSEQQAQEWSRETQALSAQSTELRTSLDSEASQRAEAQNAADFYQGKSQQLEGEAEQLTQAVIGLRQENGAMDYEIGRLRHCLSAAESENASLHSANASLEREVSSLSSSVSSLESKISCLERELCQARAACEKRK